MLVGIRTLLNSEELTRKYLEETARIIWYNFHRGANTVRINLSVLLGQMKRKSDPERSGSDPQTHVCLIISKEPE